VVNTEMPSVLFRVADSIIGGSHFTGSVSLIPDVVYRGLVAMRYPPKRWRPNPPRGHERMPRHDEFDFNNPPGPPGQGEHRFTTDDPQSWVHFDLDPTNGKTATYTLWWHLLTRLWQSLSASMMTLTCQSRG